MHDYLCMLIFQSANVGYVVCSALPTHVAPNMLKNVYSLLIVESGLLKKIGGTAVCSLL